MKHMIIKLVTGEELIGLSEGPQTEDGFINIESPQIIQYKYDASGNYGLTLFPFISTSVESLFTFKLKDVILYTQPNKIISEYFDSYIKNLNEDIHVKSNQKQTLVSSIRSNLIH